MKWFQRLFSNKIDKQGPADNDRFVALIQTAMEDETINRRVKAIVSIESFHRKSLLNSLIADMKLRSATSDLIQAFGYLLDDGVANRVRSLLGQVD